MFLMRYNTRVKYMENIRNISETCRNTAMAVNKFQDLNWNPTGLCKLIIQWRGHSYLFI